MADDKIPFPEKLVRLLTKNQYIIESAFAYKNTLRYLKILSMQTGDCVMLYIDPEFNFEPQEGHIPIKFVDFIPETDGSVIDKFLVYPDTSELEGKYKTRVVAKAEEPNIESRYNHKIYLKDADKPKLIAIKSCFRQLQRLSLVTRDLRYKLAILDGNYLFVVEDDDIINCYQYSATAPLQFAIVVSMELFFKKMAVVREDCETIKRSMHALISKNYQDSFVEMKSLVQLIEKSFSSFDVVSNKTMALDASISKTTDLLDKINAHLQELVQQYKNFDAKVESRTKSKLEESIKSTEALKQKLLTYLITQKQQKDRLFLALDQIDFDTSIFANGICKRIKEFDEIKK